ncbi:chemotaxis protein CheB [Singulisphaera acidiphila]|nr:chemotaxis protein CheB [Singulisphaera acidiphila]
MRKIRVLIIGGSFVVRRMLAEAIAADPALEVLGIAAGARLGLAKIEQGRPDLVVLGGETSKGDGSGILAAIQRAHPRLSIILFGEEKERRLDRSAANSRALDPGRLAVAIHGIPGGLIATIKRHGVSDEEAKAPRNLGAAIEKVEILVIGASTGGPDALALLLSSFRADFPVPILIVQHLPPNFTRYLVDRLAHHSALGVQEAAPGDRLLPGHAWLAPGNVHLVVARDSQGVCVRFSHDPPEQSCRPSVDVLFRSVAAVYGPAALAVVLTGMGRDGLAGCAAIRAAGGQVLVQDEATSVVWGMPGQVSRAGLADLVLPLGALGPEIDRRSRERWPARRRFEGESEEAPCR